MNGKTAKVIRRYATLTGLPYRRLKSEWGETKKRSRNAARKDMLEAIKH